MDKFSYFRRPHRLPAVNERARIHLPPVAVLGLGRFGMGVSLELAKHGVEVLGVDGDEKMVQECAPLLTQTVTADCTDMETLKQLGIDQMQYVVLGIGTDLESSILVASNLVDLEIPHIWAKADSDAHAKILSRMGIDHVVRPELDTGRRVAHLLGGSFQDFTAFAEDLGMVKMPPPRALVDSNCDGDSLMGKYGLYVASIHYEDDGWGPWDEERRFNGADMVVFAGALASLEAFARR